MKKQKQNSMLLREAMECIYSASKANQKSDMPKVSGIQITFHYSNGFTSVASIDKGKGEYRRGGLLFSKHLDKGYIVLQSVYTKRGKPIRWSVQWKNSVIFYKEAEKK